MDRDRSETDSFGSVLKAFRSARHLTQQQLADRLGVRRNTIGSWERGDFLPASKTLVLELARHLKLDEQESRSLLEASLTALAPYWQVPSPRNSFFTGREDLLTELHTQLGGGQTVALRGLGGVGKTQIALEYAYRYALEYRAVFWLAAERSETILSGLLAIAEAVQLPGRDDPNQARAVAAVQRWLATHGGWLMIWDNVEDLDLLRRFLPPARQGVHLLTTRLQALGTLAHGLDLPPMDQEEGIFFLLRRAKLLAPEASREQVRQLTVDMPPAYAAAAALVENMGGLPLALDQAGAYLEETQCGLPAYLDLFRTRRAVLLQQRGERASEHPDSVSTTFAMILAATARHHPAIWDLLRVCACLQPDAIPEEIFRQGAELLGSQLQAVCHEPLEWNRLLGVACSSSLLSRQPEEQTLSLHRLVQTVLLDGMTEAEREQWNTRVIQALNAVFPDFRFSTEYTFRRQSNRLLSHVLHCLRQAGTDEEALTFASLAHRAALTLGERASYAEAEALSLRALQIREQALGPDHPEVASSLHHLGYLYWSQGKYAEAEPLHVRVLQIREQVQGPDHPEVADTLNNLANLYRMQGRYAEAEPLYLRALHIREQAQGPDHPDLAGLLDNLAIIYCEQGMYAEAEPLRLKAVYLREQGLGPDHPGTALSLNNLAELYREQGRYAEAEPLYLRALRIHEQAQGPDHPDLAFPLNNLADLYYEQGQYAKVEPLYLRALRLWQMLGPDHPLVAFPLTGLANLYREQGRDEEAEVFYRRALTIREHHLDANHPEMAESFYDLALLRQKQGQLHEARALAERALAIRSQALGDVHPKTVATRTLRAQLLQEQAHAEGRSGL